MSFERPIKRVRQACDSCRRKKSRCTGEKPVCSHCSRLRQACFYTDERRELDRPSSSIVSPSPQPRNPGPSTGDDTLERRLKLVESQLADVLANQTSTRPSTSSQVSESPARVAYSIGTQLSPKATEVSLPPWEVVHNLADAYLLYCDCQPLPLFHRPTFMQSLKNRDPEVLFSVLALTERFSTHTHSLGRVASVGIYVEAARAIVSKRVFEGTVELSTIQSLCLLSLVDFSNGQTRRASVHSSLAMSLAHNAGLTSETNLKLSNQEKEERRRCFWSLFLLKKLHGADYVTLDFSAEDNFPWYPETTGNVPQFTPQVEERQIESTSEAYIDKGIVAYAIQLSEVWFKITRYAWRRGKPSNLPPWSLQSEYAIILAQQMDFETRMPYVHRFSPAKFAQKSIEYLNSNRDYWGPWLFVQFLYHTNLCLLNHPLLLSLRLRNIKCVIPEIFLQQTTDLISSHSSWIINIIDMLEAKQFKITDPFLAHCVAIIATIYLQGSVVGHEATRKEKKGNFERCLQFIRNLGMQWPHVGRIADKLQRLSETVSSAHVASEEPVRKSHKLLIDLGQFFEVLEYASSSEMPGSGKQLFGPSLQLKVGDSRREMAQTSVLPEPTRVERQEFGNSVVTPDMDALNASPSIEEGTVGSLNYSDDELAVLAESFFNQRNEFDGTMNWWNVGNI